MRRSRKFQSFDGTSIAYRTYGELTSAAPLVCCSGIACDEIYWRDLAPRLSNSRVVVTWDYPYHGNSSPASDPDEIGIVSLARHLHGLTEELALRRVVLAGHSMGVQVMLEYYRDHLAGVAGMISIAGPYQHTVGHLYGTNLGHGMLRFLALAAQSQPEVSAVLWRLIFNPRIADPVGRLGGLIGRAPTEVMDHYFQHLSGMEVLPLLKMFQAGQNHSAGDMLHDIRVPVLILHGTRDVMTPLGLAVEMKDRIPDCELVAVDGGAHTLPAEDTNLIRREIERFLAAKVDR